MLLKAITYQCDGFKHFCSTLLGEIIQIDDHVFSKGLVPPMIFSFNWVGFILIFRDEGL